MMNETTYVIQVNAGGRWVNWSDEGGGDAVVFDSEEAARRAALHTGELLAENENETWRVR